MAELIKSKEELEEMKVPYEEYCRKAFAPGKEWEKSEALKGIRWLSCTMYIFTPHSAANLAELGAEVIKIEIPRMGDAMRPPSPFNEAYLYPLHDTRPMTGTGFGFLGANVNEIYLSMDYHIPEMVNVFYGLVKMSDGLTELYRPGTLHWRRKPGLGTMIEFSQVQTPTRISGYTFPLYGRFGIVRQRWGNWDTQLCVHGIILCGKSDFPDAQNPQDKFDARYVRGSAFNDPDFKELCDSTGLKDSYRRYKAHKDRVDARPQVEIYTALEKWAADKTRSQVVKTHF